MSTVTSQSEYARFIEWQQHRRKRVTDSQRESAIVHLSDVIKNNMDAPASISSVRIEGADRTRHSFLASLINPRLPHGTVSFEDVLHTTRRISDALHRADLFSRLSARIERARNPAAGPHDVDIVFAAKERGRFVWRSSTEIGNNEGSATSRATVRNLFGGGELFNAQFALGTKTRFSFGATLTAPLGSNLDASAEVGLFRTRNDWTSFASCTEDQRGFRAAYNKGDPKTSTGTHEFAFQVITRHICDLTPSASISIRRCAGQSLKTSISHTYVHDSRDDRLAATRGYYAKITQELAGIGGRDARFYKVSAEGQISRPMWRGLSAALSARGGVLFGLGDAPTYLSDRFQLGGPLSVRGFKSNGLGPRDGADSLGGDVHWSTGLSIVSALPRREHWPVKLHAWTNVGRLDTLQNKQPPSPQNSISHLLSRPSIAAGVGILYNFDPIRFEVNFGVPLTASASDGMNKGLQVGVGLEFL
ncbi:hypothetical protein FISHEDRAFT_53949 [Fistulina hepatica ATCC 64428]|uniref:Bacterial surface antigen (D15) domain-containing protein n=1 Tax=Fistulina hepatica ATCC 64428 TaxID=1128425 RepID=A0A0D7A2P2_9AGAR|nr:hypothetical protein FISHEDRAFT_53949 [Fistulina hepatica ATCC 64428]